jgi:ubiquinone/menaquinone biosynthesis C-methylase UbiE
MSLASKLATQCQKPIGWLGRRFLLHMNNSHSLLTDWGLTHVSIASNAAVLDVGCGGGRTIAKLAARASEGRVYGVDHSAESVAMSRKTNARAIERGHVDIRQATVSRLPFSDNTFDLATAIETHFYWPSLGADLREILRVLKPGGMLVIVAEVYKGGKNDEQVQKFAELMKKSDTHYENLSVAEHRELFVTAGYSAVQVFEEYERGWICAVGKKPESPKA